MTIEHELTDPVDEYQTPKQAFDEALVAHLHVINLRLAECESALMHNRLICLVTAFLLAAHLFFAP